MIAWYDITWNAPQNKASMDATSWCALLYYLLCSTSLFYFLLPFFLSFSFLHFFLRLPLISSFLFFSVPWLPFSLIYSRLCDTQQNYLLPLTCDGILLPSRLFVDHAESSPTGDRRSSIALANNLCLGRLRTLFSKSWGWGYVIKNITLTATVTEQNRTGLGRTELGRINNRGERRDRVRQYLARCFGE